MWRTRRFFDAQTPAWEFDSWLKLPSLTAGHSQLGEVLQMAREAFHAAAGILNEWPHVMTFLAVHCKCVELMSADTARAISLVLGLLWLIKM
jgi:hypothetical protein